MRYLVTTLRQTPFFTDYWDYPNFWNDGIIAIYDLDNKLYTTDGLKWQEIKIDHL